MTGCLSLKEPGEGNVDAKTQGSAGCPAVWRVAVGAPGLGPHLTEPGPEVGGCRQGHALPTDVSPRARRSRVGSCGVVRALELSHRLSQLSTSSRAQGVLSLSSLPSSSFKPGSG